MQGREDLGMEPRGLTEAPPLPPPLLQLCRGLNVTSLPPSLRVAGLGKGPGETPAWKKGAVFGAGEEEAGAGM